AEAQGEILNADLLNIDLAEAAWSQAGNPSSPATDYNPLNLALLNQNVQLDLGGGLQLPLIGEGGSGLLQLGQLGALHSYASAPSATHAIAAAGAVANDGTIALDTVEGQGGP